MIPAHEWQRLKLNTKRLQLLVIDESYAERALAFVMRNREALAEWEPERNEAYFTLESQRKLIQQDRLGMNEGQSIRFWLKLAGESDGELIGTASISNIVRGAFQSCHLGYRMDAAYRNSGYMTEALSHVVAFAFEQLNLHRIEANVMPRNAPSLKVCERLGFRREGLAHDYLRIAGKWEDHIHMVLLHPSWSER
ncbi:GNAT family N-acetyltransferase [Paenibacillus rhizovicinus]|uniref:GNAT family N-acetyltransferase n=1 Tax=Paenibacillus rhizovicinus TaxID=2704463 RepID=A0A6C0P6W0_9BACL|nr:GNAT family N-acetyltransferase [Paenibacillus rhizovicinus]QHW34249.1 GNAT family N-acetyltransferase [Paenibacillus rhizovicinus]